MKKNFIILVGIVSSVGLTAQVTVPLSNSRQSVTKASFDTISIPNSSVLAFADGTAIDVTKPPVTMPSPNSAVLTNLISENVDLYTGKTNVSLPLYTFKSGSISIPIALQCNVNAHRVNDIGTWTGLGWNFNSGGTITRIMKSLPDEFTGTIPSFNIPGWGYIHIKGNGQNVNLSNFDAETPATKRDIIGKGNWNRKANGPDRGWDLMPDEFFFNFGNYSGKFVFDQDGGINLIPRTNLKIAPLFQTVNGINKLSGFIVLTDDGFKYEFGNSIGGDYNQAPIEETKATTTSKSLLLSYRGVAVDGSNNVLETGGMPLSFDVQGKLYWVYERQPYLLGAVPVSSCNNSPDNPQIPGCLETFDESSTTETTEQISYPSSWMLRKITSPNGDFVDLNYSAPYTITYKSDRNFTASVPGLADNMLKFTRTGGGYLTFNPTIGNANLPVYLSAVSPNYDQARKIFLFPTKQNLTVSETSIELKTRRLLSIISSESNSVQFTATTAREDLPGDNRLDFLAIYDKDNHLIKKFDLGYNVVTTTETEEPNEQYEYHYHLSRYYNVGGSFAYMKSYFNYSDLVTIPADGITRTWSVPVEFRKRMFLVSVQESGNGIVMPPYTFSYNSTKLPYRTSTNQDFYGFANENQSRHPFTSSGHFQGYLYTYFNYPYNLNSPVTFPVSFFGSVRPVLYFNPPGYSPVYGGSKAYSSTKIQAGVLNKITYPTGGYKEFSFEYNGNAFAWNGLRVSQIREYESSQASPIIKNYTYGTFVNTDATLLSENYQQLTNNHVMGEVVDIRHDLDEVYYASIRKFFSSDRVNSQSLTKGAAGGYTYAEISQPNNGRQRVDFFTAIDFADQYPATNIVSCHFNIPVRETLLKFPFPSSTSFDWLRGMPKLDQTFAYNNGQPERLVKTEEYIYVPNTSVYGKKDIVALTTTRYKVWAFPTVLHPNCGEEQVINDWILNLFARSIYTSAWHPMVTKKTRLFDMDGLTYTESIQDFNFKKYTYNNTEYLLPYFVKDQKNSKNEQTISTVKYPLDYNSSNQNDPFLQGISNLLTKHVLSAKVEQYAYRQDQSGNNKKYIGGILTKYDPVEPLPKEVFKLKSNGQSASFIESNTNNGWFGYDPSYQSEVNFTQYDNLGRVQEQMKANDIKETYVWNYNKMYPVAKILNANSADVAFTSFEADESDGRINFATGNVVDNPNLAFTGRKYYQLTNTITTNITPLVNSTYKLTLWAKGGDLFIQHLINGVYQFLTIPTPVKTKAGGWNYYEITMPSNFSGAAVIGRRFISDNVLADEVRLIPSMAQMTTYTFDPLIGMTSETDVNGKTTYYEYDGLNRLSVVRNENKDIVKTICYNYANQQVPCSVGNTACNGPVPVINSVTKTGSSGNNWIYSIGFTPTPNSTSCIIQLTDITAGTVTPIPISCTSPATIQIPKLHQFSIVLISYTAACPGGIYSLPYP